ncbi:MULTISPECIES: acyl-CoA synthetase [unclassified Beijerinckia]|uniref:acyl-CoA synthetase n=1 Tax=unclassified Beijerinckia TaxID=2638183 RepID=UPI00089A6D7A|nr:MULTISPECIES: acyl-CoA synthetase [unclassified Beijerinckia]MDH7794232.1 fatty-acyl-CoA synthase [Beijerinckia sp. GAS462]SEB56403.1 fatty-acyl-CoA synthase [Beijerinckia sp. 28-YEA-48]
MKKSTETTIPSMPVVAQTADAELLARPLRGAADIEEIERVPLDERLSVVNFYRRIALALEAHDPGRTAISFVADGDPQAVSETVSFGELRRNIALTATLLRDHGIGRGDVVAILLPTVPAIYWSIIGTMSRAIPFPLNWMLEPHHVLDLLSQARVKAVIALGPTPGFKIWESLSAIRDRLPPDLPIWTVPGPGGEVLPGSDLALAINRLGATSATEDVSIPATGEDVAAYLHSGGTTGLPKIVRLAHRNISYRHWTLQLAQQIQFGEVMLQDTPIFHVGGLAGRSLPMLASGASLVIPSILGARDKRYMANYWKFVEQFRITRLSGVPTMFAALAKAPPQGEDLSSLQPNFMTGSTALPLAVREEFERISGVRILNSYGLTENTATVAVEPRDGIPKQGSSGMRVPYTEVRIVALGASNDTLRLSGPQETGMIHVRGPGITLGYLDAVQTAASRTRDGWLITGDLGRIDEDGMLYVTGRAKDVIIRGGHNIDPGPIEEALLRSPAVLHAAAVAKPDAYAGELPIAYVQLVPGATATEAELIAFAAARVNERPAVPKEVIILEKMPLTDVGKPIKAALRQDAAERAFRAALADACPDTNLQVVVQPHATHGSLVSIRVLAEDTEYPRLKTMIDGAMNQYAVAYEIILV